jgi:hypothetical protein
MNLLAMPRDKESNVVLRPSAVVLIGRVQDNVLREKCNGME